MECRVCYEIGKICYTVHMLGISKTWRQDERPGFFEAHEENEKCGKLGEGIGGETLEELRPSYVLNK